MQEEHRSTPRIGIDEPPRGYRSEFVILEFPVPGSDVALPYFPLSIDAEGNLYGVSFTSVNGIQMAVVYEVSPPATHGGTWTANSLYTVGSDTPSRYTYITSSAFISRTGAIFGSAYTYCEHSNAFCGYAYRLTPPAPNSGNPWKEAIVFQSNGPSVPWLRGIAPSGTTLYGGADFYFGAGGYVFELSQ
jgi:hypothetical protein